MNADAGRRPRGREAGGRRASRAGAAGRNPGLPVAAIAALPVWALALLAASPDAPSWWGLNPLRSVPAAWPALGLAAAAALTLGLLRPRRLVWWVAAGVALALALAFPLRESIHVLGDTQLRLRALFAVGTPSMGGAFAETWARLHASPLDLVVNVLAPLALHSLGLRVVDAVSVVGVALALAYAAILWRLASRLGAPEALRGPLALALGLTGTLQAFAGYADSAGLVAVAVAGWWAEMLAPLRGPSQAWRTVAWFTVLLLSHRMAFVMVVPQLLRALAPPLAEDRPEARRLLAMLGIGAASLVAGAALFAGTGRQLAADLGELGRSARGFAIRPGDLISALAVVAPLALAAPALAPGAARGAGRDPRLGWLAAAAVPLLVALIWVFPAGESGLGAHRDWDTNVLLGVTLTVAAGVWLARAEPGRLGATLAAALPLLALTALAWVAVNADRAVATRRAMALAVSAESLTPPQRAHLHLYFGQRAMDELRPDVAARHYERAFDLAGNPRRAVLAAEAWMMAEEPAAARAALARARAGGALPPELERGAGAIEARLPPDSSQAR